MISFSGIDCCGKSTQIQLICEQFDKVGKKYEVIWSRGGYTPGIEWIKKLIRHGKTESKESRILKSTQVNENSFKRKVLFVAGLIDLCAYYSIVLRVKGLTKEIICDRYIWDTYIDYKMKYPDYRFDKGFWWNLTLKTMVKPKPSFCLFIPAEMSMYRSSLKKEPFPEPVEVRQKRINWYESELSNHRWDHIIDATRTVDEVYTAIKENL